MLIRRLIFWLSNKKAVTQAIARRGMRYGFARRFVAGETLGEALDASASLNSAGRRVSLNHLGENVSTPAAALSARDSYLKMLRELAGRRIDGNISLKLTQLGLDQGRELCEKLAAEIAATAKELKLSVEIDMEGSAYTGVTLEIFESVCRRFDNVGMAMQAYLRRTEKDLERLSRFRPKIRLVKGAYREPASVAFQKKPDVDANYVKLLGQLLSGGFFPAIATHDPAILAFAQGMLRRQGLSSDRYEFQMIYGVRRDLQQHIREAGHPLRIYVPFGSEWCPYFMRRLAERPANCGFVLRSLLAESARSR